jgi:hypothetical protein
MKLNQNQSKQIKIANNPTLELAEMETRFFVCKCVNSNDANDHKYFYIFSFDSQTKGNFLFIPFHFSFTYNTQVAKYKSFHCEGKIFVVKISSFLTANKLQ